MPRQAARSTSAYAKSPEPEALNVSLGQGMRVGFCRSSPAAVRQETPRQPETQHWSSWRVVLLEGGPQAATVDRARERRAVDPSEGRATAGQPAGRNGRQERTWRLCSREAARPHTSGTSAECPPLRSFQALQPVISVIPNLKLEGSCALKASCPLPGTEKWGWGGSGWGRVLWVELPLGVGQGLAPHLFFVPGMSVFPLCAWREHGVFRKVQMRWGSELLWGLK